MDAAIYGLIGAIIGGVITMVVSVLNNRHNLKLRKLELEAQALELRRKENFEERKERLKRYGDFLGAYHLIYGFIVDMITMLKDPKEDLSARINEIVDSKEFLEAIVKINEAAGWTSLICQDQKAAELAGQLSSCHDDLLSEMRNVKNALQKGQKADIEKLEQKFDKLESCFKTLSGVLRNDWK